MTRICVYAKSEHLEAIPTRLEKKEELTSQWSTQKVTMIILQERKGSKGQEKKRKNQTIVIRDPYSNPSNMINK